jgi:ipoprotein LpqH
VWANNTKACARWHERPGQTDADHLKFAALHVHPAVLAWADRAEERRVPGWVWAAAHYGYLMASTVAIRRIPRRRRLLGAALTAGGVLLDAALGPSRAAVVRTGVLHQVAARARIGGAVAGLRAALTTSNFARLSLCRLPLLYCHLCCRESRRGDFILMKRRFSAAAAFLVAVGLAGCSSPPAALASHDARVIINGKATNALQPVTCYQTGQSWTIETLDKEPGFTATIELGDTVTAEVVDIRNLGNFTGIYWDDNLGKAQAKVNQGKFNVSGEAEGAFGDKPNKRTTAMFDITTDC